MYYSIELLSARRRSKLAKCWFAATLNDDLFLKRFKNSSIRDTDVIAVCDEILRTICSATNNRSQRYSLYLSSQLMFGVAKIHYYQINIFQRELFELRIKLERVEISDHRPKKKRQLDLHGIGDYTIQEPLTLNLIFNDVGQHDSHRLWEESVINAKLQNLMQDADCLNFGALTNMEMEEFLVHDGMAVSELVMLIPGENGMDTELIIDREVRVAEENKTSHVDLNRGKEKHNVEKRSLPARISHGSHVIRADASEQRGLDINIPVPDDIEGLAMELEPPEMPSIEKPETPSKRLSKQPEVDTPTKRRRLEAELNEQVHPAVESIVIPEDMQDSELHLEPIDLNLINNLKRPRRSTRRIFHDTRIEIRTGTLQAMINDVNVHTVPMQKRLITFIGGVSPEPEKLFRMPATIMQNVLRGKWANELHSLFDNPITTKIHAETYEELHITKPLSDSPSTEVMRRADTINQTQEISSNISRKDKTVDKTKSDEQSVPHIEVDRAAATMPEISMPDMPDIPENVNEMEIVPMEPEVPTMEINESEEKDDFLPPILRKSNIQKRMHEKHERIASEANSLCSIRSNQSLKRQWTKEDFLASLEVLWHEKQAIKFAEICAPSHNSKLDAADCFKFCLEMSVLKKLRITQRGPYHNIWITKVDYSTGSTTNE